MHDICSLFLEVSTFCWLRPSRAATLDKSEEVSNRAVQNDSVAAYGDPAEPALVERLRMPTTDVLTRQSLQVKGYESIVVACCFAGKL